MTLQDLNDAQRRAASFPLESQLQILAGPGTGKTKTLTSRIAYLIRTYGLDPRNIIVMTFTNAAATEMKQRVSKLLNDESVANKLKIGTFHSIAVRYLHAHGRLIGLDSFTVADETDRQAIFRRIMKDPHFLEACGGLGQIPHVRTIIQTITKWKCEGVTVKDMDSHEPTPERVAYIYLQAMLEATKQLDFDDILLRMKELLTSHPQVVDHVEAVLVDEFQDSNALQLELMCLFAQKRNRITVVGDPDQSIYGFRNADPENLAIMTERFPGTEQVCLEHNYRSTQQIVNLATGLFQQEFADRLGGGRSLIAQHQFETLRPWVVKFRTTEAEILGICRHILYLTRETDGLFGFGDIAILSRTNDWGKAMEVALMQNRIPYKVMQGYRFWDRVEVRTIVDYLRVVNNGNDWNAVARTLNMPKRGFGPAMIDRLSGLSYEDLFAELEDLAARPRSSVRLSAANRANLQQYCTLIKSLKSMQSVEEMIDRIVDETELLEDPARAAARRSSIAILRAAVAASPYTALADVLVDLALDGVSQANMRSGNVVTISTIHSAKGLEWPVVFCGDCTDQFSGFLKRERAESCRCLFVALTRAKAINVITYPTTKNMYGNAVYAELASHLRHSHSMAHLQEFKNAVPKLKIGQLKALAQILGRPAPQKAAQSGPPKAPASDFTSGRALLDLDVNVVEGRRTKKAKKDKDGKAANKESGKESGKENNKPRIQTAQDFFKRDNN